MKTPDPGCSCQEAREYYYDLLNPEDTTIPEAVRRHIERCGFCREQVRHLDELLADRSRTDSVPSPGGDETIEALGLHFEHLGARMTCARVRPLLANLLSLPRAIRIPTPVTVHLDHCPACAEDLAALRALNLRPDQLKRLSGLYDRPFDQTAALCRKAQSAVSAVGAFALAGIDTEILDHLSVCPRCRDEIYRHRDRLAAAGAAPPAHPQPVACRDVSMADLFDYVVPYGLGASAGAATSEHAQVVARHVRACPPCAEKAQILHRTVYTIAERADSEIATVYHVKDDAADSGDDAVPRYPVSVEVLHCSPAPTVAAGHAPSAAETEVKTPVTGPRHRLFARIVTVAAAVVIVSVLFRPTVPTASGTNIGKVLRALERAPGIYTASFTRDSTRPFQETWSARGLGLFATRGSRGCTLYDLNRRQRRTTDPEFGNDGPVTMGREECVQVRAGMVSGVLGVLGGVAQGTELHPATADGDDAAAGAFRLYEVIGTPQGYAGSAGPFRWIIWLDPATQLPRRIESFHKRRADDAWTLAQTHLFEYPTEADIRSHITALFPR